MLTKLQNNCCHCHRGACWYGHFGKTLWQLLIKVKHIYPIIPTPRYLPTRNKNLHLQKDLYINILKELYSKSPKTRNHSNVHQPASTQVMVHPCSGPSHSNKKKTSHTFHTWAKLKSQIQTASYYIIPFIPQPGRGSSVGTEIRLVAARV